MRFGPAKQTYGEDIVIIPNLLVSDIARSVTFYRDRLGLKLALCVGADKSYTEDGSLVPNPVFAILEWEGDRLMLQTAASLAEDLSCFSADQKPVASGAVYLQGYDPDSVADKFEAAEIIKGPETAWYGMREIHVTDPDGYVLSLGRVDESVAPDQV